MSAETWIGLGLRTPVGRERGMLRELPAWALAAAVIRCQAALLDGEPVDRVILANVAAPGNVARVAALAAGLGPTVPAVTVNEQCSGGLAAVRMAVEAVAAGSAGLVIAGGTESVSQSTILLEGGAARRAAVWVGKRTEHAPPGWPDPEMGPAADATAASLRIDRAAQDLVAHRSYERTLRARAAGFFVPLIVIVEEGSPDDESPRSIPRFDRMGRYPPAFGGKGTVTAANAAAVGDGAAAVVVGSARFAGAQARVIAAASAASDSALPALAVVPAIERALADAGLRAGEIDRWEINEAFAVKIVACVRRFGLDEGCVNVNGGAIAYGHPFSASGAILLVHVLRELVLSGSRFGLAAIAGAGGVGEAMVVERLPASA